MHVFFPSNFVYWNKVKNHEKIKEKYYTEILKNKNTISKNQNWVAEVVTSYNNSDWNKIFFNREFCDNVIWPYFDNMLEKLSDNIPIPEESYLSECWVNLYEKGNFQEPHQHGKPFNKIDGRYHSNVFCGIYLLHLEEKNKTVFFQDTSSSCGNTDSKFNFMTDFIEEGNVIFFPSTLLHYVLPSEKERCTISFNLTSVYNPSETFYPKIYQ